MSHYIHHVPGRLRVKSPHLKRNEHAAARVTRAMEQFDGVVSTEVSTVTGSLVVKYDASRVAPHALLECLHGLGHAQVPGSHLPVYISGGKNISDTFVNKLVETALERSATALIAALI